MSPKYNIIIVGGGIVGLAASIGLARKGHSIRVLESQSSLRNPGSGITIPTNAATVLNQYGVYDAITKRCEKTSYQHVTKRYDGELISNNMAIRDGTVYGIR
jgi:salicylate hydroxylase